MMHYNNDNGTSVDEEEKDCLTKKWWSGIIDEWKTVMDA